MRIHPRKRHKPQDLGPKYYINKEIRAEKVRVIDENEEHLGVMDTAKAVAIAEERGYDLVEVSPKAEPPTCKLLNFGQFKYEKEREARKNKVQAKATEMKGIRLTPRIGPGDMETRIKNAVKFLEAGNKLKIEMRMRGREKAFQGMARDTIQTFIDKLKESYDLVIEQPIQKAGGQLTAIIGKR